MIKEGDLAGEEEKKEFYMSGVFQRFIKAAHIVKGVDVHPSWILGTPAQFALFQDFLDRSKIIKNGN